MKIFARQKSTFSLIYYLLSSKVSSSLKGAEKRDLIRILKVTAHRNTVCESRDSYSERLQKSREIHGGRLTLYRGVGGNYDLLDLTLADA